jgi:chromosome segregation ATPase
MMMGGTMNSMGGAMTGGFDAKSAKEKEEEIERLRDEAKERDKEKERLTKQMKAQKRQLEDSLQGTRRELSPPPLPHL